MSLAFVPFYIRAMGIEAYGLIGFYLTLQGLLQILDLGLSPTMNREMARYSVQPSRAEEARDFVRTVEVCYWGIGLLIGVGVVAFAPLISRHWLQTNALPASVVETAIASIGIVLALQWPLSLYLGGLQGLRKQVELNSVQVAVSTLRNAGAAMVLYTISPTITAFFAWQIVASAVQTTAVRTLLWRHVPGTRQHRPRMQLVLLKNVWRFAAGVSGVALSALVLTQLDKFILSTLLTLEQFGFYTLAASVGTGLGALIGPVFNVVFPRLSVLVVAGDTDAVTRFYHRGAQVMTVVVMPAAAILVVFSYEIMWLWTSNAATARYTSPLVSALALGTALNGVMTLPYSLQLAYGRTVLALRINMILVAVMVPGIIVLSKLYGPMGAAVAWVLLNSLYLVIGPPLTHRSLLRGQGWRWFIEDVGIPAVAVVVIAAVGRQFVTSQLPRLALSLGLGSVLLLAVVVAVFAAPQMRSQGWTLWETSRSQP